MAKEIIYVIGHKSPDTDTVCSAIAYAQYLQKIKINAAAAICGQMNPETKFVLKYFKANPPKKIESATNKTLVLVDHNEKSQMVDGADNAKIVEILDHHKIAFDLGYPIKFCTRPVGSTATIVAKIMMATNFKITKQLAGILVSAILSDTVVFKSTTTTPEDIYIAKKLGKIAGIANLKKFGIEIKKQKASLKGLTAEQILHSDYKEFKTNDKKFGIGQIEVVELEEARQRTNEILQKMEELNRQNNLVFTALMVTDIINEGSELLIAGDASFIENAFGKKSESGILYIKGMLSRKKDLLPPLMKALEN